MRAALVRERVPWRQELVSVIGWVLPARRLSEEIGRVLEAGYLRGADLWHVSCALHLHDGLGDLDFLTLDTTQRKVAAAAGLNTPSF